MDGFLEPIKRKEIPIKNSRILLLGAGGASRAIVSRISKRRCRKKLQLQIEQKKMEKN